MKSVILPISKTENKERVKVGEVAIVIPTLDDIVASVAGAKVKEEQDGLPLYDNDVANWVQSAMEAAAKAAARNKLKPGTAELRDGLKIATNWEEFCAESERGGNGAALALLREVKDMFSKYVATLGKSENVQKVIVTLFSSKTSLAAATDDTKGKMKKYVEDFAATLSAEDMERFERPLDNILTECENTVDLSGF